MRALQTLHDENSESDIRKRNWEEMDCDVVFEGWLCC